jgi:hypothetical protein
MLMRIFFSWNNVKRIVFYVRPCSLSFIRLQFMYFFALTTGRLELKNAKRNVFYVRPCPLPFIRLQFMYFFALTTGRLELKNTKRNVFYVRPCSLPFIRLQSVYFFALTQKSTKKSQGCQKNGAKLLCKPKIHETRSVHGIY